MNHPDRILRAAQGYLELGMYERALHELDLLPKAIQEGSMALEIRALVLIGLQRWEDGFQTALRLRSTTPDEAGGYIHAAYCLHAMGRTREALETLLAGPDSLRSRWIFFYNVACYHARLGDEEEAMRMLKRSFEIEPNLRRSALKDPDLQALQSKLRG